MSRFVQKLGQRGSLKWIQRAANESSPRYIDTLILPDLDGATRITWHSPIHEDEYAEYRDDAFLEKIGASSLGPDLRAFWPARGPQWDALGTTDAEDVLLVEAKAHISELFSKSAAGAASLQTIKRAFDETKSYLGATPRGEWPEMFYQLANRLSHLHFLRQRSIKAWLVLANFVGDEELNGPRTEREWHSAYEVVWHVLGVPRSHALSRYVLEIFPQVSHYERENRTS